MKFKYLKNSLVSLSALTAMLMAQDVQAGKKRAGITSTQENKKKRELDLSTENLPEENPDPSKKPRSDEELEESEGDPIPDADSKRALPENAPDRNKGVQKRSKSDDNVDGDTAEKDEFDPKAPKPGFEHLTTEGREDLLKRANEGDEQAQYEIIQRFYWDAAPWLKANNIVFQSWTILSKKANENPYCAFFVLKYLEEKLAQDFPDLIQNIEERARKDNAVAQNLLGIAYGLGVGVSQNSETAVEWHKKAANQNYAVAQFNLGHVYWFGEGIDQNKEEAMVWFRKAADQDNAAALYNLGIAYWKGKGVDQNKEEALRWFRKAADQDNAAAQHNLGHAYWSGRGVPQDDKEAVKWLQKAADQGHANAQYFLGAAYKLGRGVPQDYKETLVWLQKAADQGHADAQYNLGNAYWIGTGIKQDYKEAMVWFLKAADQGHANAQYYCGMAFQSGKGVDRNSETAVMWYQKAASQGHAYSQHNLGGYYRFGRGVDKSIDKTVELLWLSACQKYKGSIDCICTLFPFSTAAPQEEGTFQELIKPIQEDEALNAAIEVETQMLAYNSQGSFFENQFSIPEIFESSKAIASLKVEVSDLLNSLNAVKPGFMVSVVSSSQEIKDRMKTDPKTTFFDVDSIDGKEYVTLHRENLSTKNKLLELLKRKDEFVTADKKLAELLSHYLPGSDSLTSRLLKLRVLIDSVNQELSVAKELPELVKQITAAKAEDRLSTFLEQYEKGHICGFKSTLEEVEELVQKVNNSQVDDIIDDKSHELEPIRKELTEFTDLFRKGMSLPGQIERVTKKIEDLHNKRMEILSTLEDEDEKKLSDVKIAQSKADQKMEKLLSINKKLKTVLEDYKDDINKALTPTVENLTRAQGVFCKMSDELERLIPRGAGRRNKAFVDEYPFIKGE